ncbi:hypothetical protein H4Q26_010519 [Puccinia striiformis f. sp. tritici PST-130]|nr:hypothetical protein H4Q26_010519 [Puccinia striiformis f. sp. tritici PST-130]
MSQLADHSRDRELLYATLGGLQPVGTCLAWVVGLTICEALRLTQRFDPKTSLIKRIFVYFSLVMSVAVLRFESLHICYSSLGIHELGSNARSHSCCTTYFWALKTDPMSLKHLDATSSASFWHLIIWLLGSRPWEVRQYLVFSSTVKAHECLGEAPGLTYYSYDVIGLLTSIIEIPHLKLIEGAVLTFLKAYDLVKSGAVKKVLATRDDPHGFSWSLLCCLCQTAILPTVFDLIAVSLPAPKGVNGTAYALSSISAELHLFGPIVAISAALDDMNVSSGELHCSLENTLTRETSQSILASDQGRKVSFKTPEMGRRKYMT